MSVMNLVERFIAYTRFDTQSDEESATVPSTREKQMKFAEYLTQELRELGLAEVEMDDKGYVYATLESNVERDVPTIGFIAHYDTAPDASGRDVKARVVHNYDGEDITLSEGVVTKVETFPELLLHKGEDLIVTDSTTLL